MREMTKNRYIDFLKGITIILVLFGHSLQYGSGQEYLAEGLYWDNLVMKGIYSFHMPVFIAVSGYLFAFSVERKGVRACIMKKIRTLMPVCASWSVILLVYDRFCGIKMPFRLTLKRLFVYFLTDFWFLWAIVFCVVCTAFAEAIITRINSKWQGG